MTSIDDATEVLLLLYDLTGDQQYLASLSECRQWGLNMPEEYRGYLYYDSETGEPVTAKDFKLYKFSDSAFQEALPYRTSPRFFNDLQERINARTHGPLIPSQQGVDPPQRVREAPHDHQ